MVKLGLFLVIWRNWRLRLLGYTAWMGILAQENEIALVMEQVRVHQNTAFLYGNMLISQYSEEM